MIDDFAPVVVWIKPFYGTKTELRIIAEPKRNGLIKYSVSSVQGTPLGCEYVGSTFYRERPMVVNAGWRNELREALKEHGDVVQWNVPHGTEL